MERAISIVVYDPSGKESPGTTFPPGSVWMADQESKGRERAVKQNLTSPTTVPVPGSSYGPGYHGNFCTRMGITLKSLKAWDTDRLLHLAYRMEWKSTQEARERFVTRLNGLLKKGMTEPDAIVEEAWRYRLQAIDSISAENDENDESAAPEKKSPQMAPASQSPSKDRVKRFRARREGWSPERMTTFQEVKARQRNGKKTCIVCGRMDTSPHHIIPRSEGGLPLTDNIVWLCEPHHNEVEGPYAGFYERLRLVQAEYTPTPANAGMYN